MKKALVFVAAFAVMGAAQAAKENSGCQGNCGGDTINNTTNQGGVGYGGAGGNGMGIGVGLGGQGGSGGQGGQGGQGGSGGAVVGSGNSSATGGAVVGSGNSRNDLSQHQGQGQSQAANSNQSQSSKNDNKSNAANTNSNANSGNNSAQTTRIEGDTTVSVYRAAAGTAYAGALTASNGTCMGSTTAGGQGLNFGFSVGSTWKDSGCDRRYNAQALAAVGQAKAAVALLCQDPDIKAAMETAGTPCQATKAEAQAVAAQKAESVAVAKSEPIDPIIRARIGLPPLK